MWLGQSERMQDADEMLEFQVPKAIALGPDGGSRFSQVTKKFNRAPKRIQQPCNVARRE